MGKINSEKPAVFPFKPDKVTENIMYVFEDGDLDTDKQISDLILLMFEYSEREFFLFHDNNLPISTKLRSANKENMILLNEVERFYYKHPKNIKDYVKISGNNPQFEWGKELIKKGPEYHRFTLKLSEKAKRDLEISYSKFREKQMAGNLIDKTILFISYDSGELALADFIRNILTKWTENQIEAFVARRDIPPGDNPLKVMMENKLKYAQAIIPICSIKSKSSSWVWWESAAVWAKDKKVYPLFTNISASDFGAPLTLVSQGKDYFVKEDFTNTLIAVCNELKVELKNNSFTDEEFIEYEKLRKEYSKPETSAKIVVDYKKLEMTQDYHKYSFVFDIENRTKKKFDDIIVELYFPEDYIEEKKWEYSHLRSVVSDDKLGYICLVFSFSGLPERAKSLYMSGLLPGKKLKVFGEDAITKLHYEMDHDRWEKRFKYEIQWKVYVNGGAPQEGSIPLNSIQYF